MRQSEFLKLLRTLETAKRFIEHYATRVAPGHICGPDANCDCTCIAASRDANLILDIKAAIAKVREEC